MRIAMQASLARYDHAQDQNQSGQELDSFLDGLMFDEDPLIAGDLVRYLTPSGTNQVGDLENEFQSLISSDSVHSLSPSTFAEHHGTRHTVRILREFATFKTIEGREQTS